MNKDLLNVLMISDFNVDVLRGYLQNTHCGHELNITTAPFGQVVPVLLGQDPQYLKQSYDAAVIWTLPERIIPSFHKILNFEPVDTDTILKAVDDYSQLLLNIQDKASLILIPSWSIPNYVRGYGIMDMKDSLGVRNILMKMNLKLAKNLSKAKNIYLLDTNMWLQPLGENAFSPKLWYMSKIPFDQQVFKKCADDILAYIQIALQGPKKILLLDLDDVLWGGIIGEVGWENIRLGGHDPLGEAFLDFQHTLKSFSKRGILLAIVSKNEESAVLEAFEKHPEMVLKIDDFAAFRINWKDKAENIIDLMQELNLGLQSAVFIDDSPRERARIKESLVEVLVPDWPEDKMLYKKALSELACFDTLALTDEDKKRTAMYAQEKERTQLKGKLQSFEEWIQTLGIKVVVEELNEANLPRAAQLLNKTNQMNLTTRRLGEKELMGWAKEDNRFLWTFRVSDKFGDSGLTGIVSLSAEGTTGTICDFLLSCRVIGRKVEETMLSTCSAKAQELGLKELVAPYIKTERNQPCWEFFKSSCFRLDDNTFRWELKNPYPSVEGIEINQKQKS